MYFSVVASTLVIEVVLQLLAFYYMGYAANYARRQKFYKVGRLDNTPHGHDALFMYAGALLWLVVILFAIVECIFSILGVNESIARFGTRVAGLGRMTRKHHLLSVSQTGMADAEREKTAISRSQCPTGFIREYEIACTEYSKLGRNWNHCSVKAKSRAKGLRARCARLERKRSGISAISMKEQRELENLRLAEEKLRNVKLNWMSFSVQMEESTGRLVGEVEGPRLRAQNAKGRIGEMLNIINDRSLARSLWRRGRELEEIENLHIQFPQPIGESGEQQHRHLCRSEITLRAGACGTPSLILMSRLSQNITIEEQRAVLLHHTWLKQLHRKFRVLSEIYILCIKE
ncbi:hypothetical protein BGZ60DRAFT_535749 [Tricladium varicosporioides]|nr:hypothetical protein BGZ60DRAFT_535749 [Hymenoscyphus varicosporioides]